MLPVGILVGGVNVVVGYVYIAVVGKVYIRVERILKKKKIDTQQLVQYLTQFQNFKNLL